MSESDDLLERIDLAIKQTADPGYRCNLTAYGDGCRMLLNNTAAEVRRLREEVSTIGLLAVSDDMALLVGEVRALREDNERLLRVKEAARLRRNVIIRDKGKFKGEWVAIPREDFDALRAAVQESEETE